MAWLFKRRPKDLDSLHAAYTELVGRARDPVFFAQWGVPDTLTGRFDMIAMHMALLFHRLSGEGEAATQFSQDLFDLFFRDMDRTLREMGVGDVGVPKRIEKMGSLFYGLSDALGKALVDPDPEAMVALMRRNLIDTDQTGDAEALAAYARNEFARLKAIPAAGLIAPDKAQT